MRRFQQLSFYLVAAAAISLTALCGCDLGTYSKRSADFLQANPGGVKKEMKKEEMKKEEIKKEEMKKEEMKKEETSAVDKHRNHLSRQS